MARGINKVILIGNLGADPDMHDGATAIAKISLATSESWKDKTTGERQEKTEWHRVVFFGAVAGVVGQYLKKGSQIYVEGRLQTRKWQDKEGNDRWTTEVIGNNMQMLGGGGDRPTPTGDSGSSPPRPSSPSAAPDYEEDVPF